MDVEIAADPQWYAVRVVVQHEYAVAEMLRRQGLATYTPTEIRTLKRASYAKGKAEFAVPILPGLVFVGFPSAPVWYDLLLRNHLIVAPFSLGSEGHPSCATRRSRLSHPWARRCLHAERLHPRRCTRSTSWRYASRRPSSARRSRTA